MVQVLAAVEWVVKCLIWAHIHLKVTRWLNPRL